MRERIKKVQKQACMIMFGSVVDVDIFYIFLAAFGLLPIARNEVGRYMVGWINGDIFGTRLSSAIKMVSSIAQLQGVARFERLSTRASPRLGYQKTTSVRRRH